MFKRAQLECSCCIRLRLVPLVSFFQGTSALCLKAAASLDILGGARAGLQKKIGPRVKRKRQHICIPLQAQYTSRSSAKND